MPQAAGQVKILIYLVKIKFFPIMLIGFVMQSNCLFSDISRPDYNIVVKLMPFLCPIKVNNRFLPSGKCDLLFDKG